MTRDNPCPLHPPRPMYISLNSAWRHLYQKGSHEIHLGAIPFCQIKIVEMLCSQDPVPIYVPHLVLHNANLSWGPDRLQPHTPSPGPGLQKLFIRLQLMLCRRTLFNPEPFISRFKHSNVSELQSGKSVHVLLGSLIKPAQEPRCLNDTGFLLVGSLIFFFVVIYLTRGVK
jgi:hypothetical protein